MPKSKNRKKKVSPTKGKKAHQTHDDHSDWHLDRRQQVTAKFVPNMRTKQNANWEKRS